MKLLFDQNISYRVVKNLFATFEGSVHISECKLTNAQDSDIWKYAKANDYCVVTHDDDFDDIYAMRGFPPKIIKLKTGNLSNTQTIDILKRNHPLIVDFLANKDEGFLTFYSI